MRRKKRTGKIHKGVRFFSKGSILIPFLIGILIIGGALFAGSFFPHNSTATPQDNGYILVDPSNQDPFKNLQLRRGLIVTPTPTPTPTPIPTPPPVTPGPTTPPTPTSNVPTPTQGPTSPPPPTVAPPPPTLAPPM